MRCRCCNRMLDPANFGHITDGCPCNAIRGVNHGLVPKETCTCKECDPEQTGAVRQKQQVVQTWRDKPALL